MTLEEKFAKISEVSKINVNEIKKDYETLLKKFNNDEAKALGKLVIRYKAIINSEQNFPTKPFIGMLWGNSGEYISNTKAMQTAITNGNVDANGLPIDTADTAFGGVPNPNKGKIMYPKRVNNIIGVAASDEPNSQPKRIHLALRGKKASTQLANLLFKPVRFRARSFEEQTDVFKLGSSSVTEFVVDETIEPLKNINVPDMITKFFPLVEISKLKEFHEQNVNNYDTYAVIKGTVMTITPMKSGNCIVTILDNKSIETSVNPMDIQDVTCWVNKSVPINFSDSSEILVIGKTSINKKSGKIDINAYGIYPLSTNNVNPEKITEQSLNIEDDFA